MFGEHVFQHALVPGVRIVLDSAWEANFGINSINGIVALFLYLLLWFQLDASSLESLAPETC